MKAAEPQQVPEDMRSGTLNDPEDTCQSQGVSSHAVVSAGCKPAADDGAHSLITQWFWW